MRNVFQQLMQNGNDSPDEEEYGYGGGMPDTGAYDPSMMPSQAQAPRSPQQEVMSMAMLLTAGGTPFNKSLEQASSMYQQQAASNAAYGKVAAEQQNQTDFNTLLGGGSGAPMGNQPMPMGATNPSAPTLADATRSPGVTAPQGGYAASSNSSISNETKLQAQILARSGDVKGAIKLLNDAKEQAIKGPEETTFQKALAKKDAETLVNARAGVEQLIPFKQTLNSFKKNIDETPDSLFGPAAGKVAPLLSNNAQAVESDANTIALLSRTLLKMPASGFSDADREFLVKATVGLSKSKDANRKVVDRLNSLVDQHISYTKNLENQASSSGNLKNVALDSYEKQFAAPSAPAAQGGGPKQYSAQQLESYAQDAISKGADPAAVRARIAQLSGGAGVR
jgi:hypothetical protein